MYKIYLGDVPLKTKVWKGEGSSWTVTSSLMLCSSPQAGSVKQELKHEPVSTRVKLKILPHLLRSRLAAECFPANIQVRPCPCRWGETLSMLTAAPQPVLLSAGGV